MIVRVQTGSSFKGAALYYLHDKKREGETERLTTDRVPWTHSVNCVENDPEEVIKEMQHTALMQDRLKIMAGKRTDGRPIEDTVMTVALSWSPEHKPTKEQMIAAGEGYLKHMGWGGLQALMMPHTDTAHPHLHLVVNRVNPDTGMTQDVSWVKNRSMVWRRDYVRTHEPHLARANDNNQSRSSQALGGQSGPGSHMSRAELQTWKEAVAEAKLAGPAQYQATLRAGEWDVLKTAQQDERKLFWKQTGELRNRIRAEVARAVKAEFASDWQGYAETRNGLKQEGKAYDLQAKRAVRALGNLHRLRDGKAVQVELRDGTRVRQFVGKAAIESIKEVAKHQKAYHAGIDAELKAMRDDISKRQQERIAEVAKERLATFSKERAAAYEILKTAHRDEKSDLKRDQVEGRRRPDLLDKQHGAASQLARQEKGRAARPDPQPGSRPAAATQPRLRSGEEQLRADNRPDGPRRADLGRLSEPVSAGGLARATDPAREVTDRTAGRQNENARPKTDKEAILASINANYRERRGNRGRDDDGGGGRER